MSKNDLTDTYAGEALAKFIPDSRSNLSLSPHCHCCCQPHNHHTAFHAGNTMCGNFIISSCIRTCVHVLLSVEPSTSRYACADQCITHNGVYCG